MIGYIVGIFFPNVINSGTPGPVFMALIAIIAAFGIAYIAYSGVQASTVTNFTINAIQITALLIFTVLAILHRVGHAEGSMGMALDGTKKVLHYAFSGDAPAHPSAWSVVAPHGFNSVMLQATIAIFLLCGFESIASLGEEARNPKKDIARGVLLSLLIQGLVCYMLEYFAANYFMNSAYSMADAKGSAAPIGDMMVIIGNTLLGDHEQAFMVIEAFTVFLALIGTTLACMNTGARVTYAMGRDKEVPEHFGILHGENLTPHRTIWTLAVISAVFGVVGYLYYFAGGSAPDDKTIATLPHNSWYAAGMSSNAYLAALPNGLALVTLISNFGIFITYGLNNVLCMVAYQERHEFHGAKHMLIPLFGAIANLACMAFYIIGPIEGLGVKEPLMAVGLAVIWGLYGAWYFARNSKNLGRDTLSVKTPA